MLFLYISTSFFGSVGLLGSTAAREGSSPLGHQARLLLWGIVLSSLPFVSFTLIPEALGQPSVLPVHISILAMALMPAFFAYAILQHQLLGIRRLVHKGMVYGITAFLLLVIITFAFVIPLSDKVQGDRYPLLISAVVVAGVVLFFPLRRMVQWLIDNLLYRDAVGYETFLDGMHENLATSDSSPDAAGGIANHLAQVMHLESVQVFLGDDPGRTRLVASAGRRSEDVIANLGPRLQAGAQNAEDRDYAEVRWGSDSLILVTLRSAGRYLGYLLLGPKEGGEIFVDEEKRLVAAVAPFLAVAISKGQISEELRNLNQRMVRAEEMERARVASDLHDGPLQKAILLAMDGEAISPQEKGQIAHQLVSELREVSSRLRPAILDDLGIVPAVEWLLENLPKRFGLETHLSLLGLNEEERFTPDVELALFRVGQESVNNAVKHAKATSVDVLLSKEVNSVVLKVRDNGVGFSPASQGNSGLGLSQMRERVVQLNGYLEVLSTPGHGTTVVARIPFGMTATIAHERGYRMEPSQLPLRILIVDDHQMFREGIRRRLEQEPDITVVGEAASAEDALAKVAQTNPTIVLLDIRLPRVSGIELARRLRQQWPDLKILVLTGYDFDQYVRAVARVGVSGYLLKTAPQDAVVQAIREVAAGGAVLPPSIASKVLQHYSVDSSAVREGMMGELTLRETEVLELMHQGIRNADIAERLSISPRTVEAHVSSIISKLGAQSRTGAIRVALEKGLIK